MVENEDRIEIELPVEKEFARLLRLMISGIASRMNFNLDAVDDLKIAVEEAYLMAMGRKVTGPLKVAFTIHADRLQIDLKGKVAAGASSDKAPENFGNFILDAVVDEMQADQTSGEFGLRLTKYV
ncbi:MAG: hypothetical protein Q8L35_05615 [Actinomycetota bacterium]|nr:hypothetical protein [Actinomycetota bacterium]